MVSTFPPPKPDELQRRLDAQRQAIAREVHDEIGGALAALHFDLAWIARHSTDAGVIAHAQSASQMLRQAMDASQRIVKGLHPVRLDEGLVPAIRSLVEDFASRTGVTARFNTSAEDMPVGDEIALVAFRTAQEALTNVLKHAHCTEVFVELCDTAQMLTLEITDNGLGATPSARNKPTAFGLKGLVERARSVDGWLDVSERPGHGTTLVLSVPLAAQRSRAARGKAA